ncbi:hypothetical protein NQ318_010633, partial [Aromia moschata]
KAINTQVKNTGSHNRLDVPTHAYYVFSVSNRLTERKYYQGINYCKFSSPETVNQGCYQSTCTSGRAMLNKQEALSSAEPRNTRCIPELETYKDKSAISQYLTISTSEVRISLAREHKELSNTELYNKEQKNKATSVFGNFLQKLSVLSRKGKT